MRNPPTRRRLAPQWTRPISERLTPAIKALVIVETILFVFYLLVKEGRGLLESHLALGPGLLRGELWQALTAIFVHVGDGAVVRFLFNMVGLWFVGALVEQAIGTRRLLALFFGPAVLANLSVAGVDAGLGRSIPLTDSCSFAVLALFVAFGALYDRTQAHLLGGLFLQARVLAFILVGFALVADSWRGDLGQIAGDVVVVAAAFLLSSPGGISRLWNRLRVRRVKRRYRVLDGGRRDGNDNVRYLN